MWLRRSADGELSFPSPALSVYSYTNFHEYEPVMTDLIDLSQQMGLRVHGIDSEESGQIEVNQVPSTPLAFADDFFTYRQICGIVGRRHGLLCTFMPKPFVGESGNGAHHNLSIIDATGRNALVGDLKGRCRLSHAGCALIGGLLDHADATTMLGASTINSYKRFWDVGHWASFYKAYGYNNRSCLVRVSAVGRVEVRHFDSASNPYHTLACSLAAAQDGIERNLDPGEAVSDNVFRDIRVPRAKRIPLTPDEAIAAFRADDLMKHVFRPQLYETILALREDEWQRYWAQVSDWERQFYLERWP
jgi:glutamine synthetase